MRTSLIAGVLLIVLGVVALTYKGFTYTEKEKVLDIGPIEAHAEEEKTVPISPILGALALAGGIVLVVMGSRRA